MDSDAAGLVERLLAAWDGDIAELIELVTLLGRVRRRALMEQQARLITAEWALAEYQDAVVRILRTTSGELSETDFVNALRAAHLRVKGER